MIRLYKRRLADVRKTPGILKILGMLYLQRHSPEIAAAIIGLVLVFFFARKVLASARSQANPIIRRWVWAFSAGATVLICAAQVLRPMRIAVHVPVLIRAWVGFGFLVLVMGLVAAWIVFLVLKIMPSRQHHHSPMRRRFLLTTRAAVLATPAAAAGYAVFIQRSDFVTREVSLPIAGLPPELEGLRLVQLSDIHLSPFLSERELARAVDMANEFNAHIALVTGDLITSHRDPLDRCIQQLSRLKSDAGTLACMGNHEAYSNALAAAERMGARAGMTFLRSQSRVLRFGGRPLNFAGVDYQPLGLPYLVGADSLMETGMPNILLSHNPDVFPVAAEMGYDAIISGHTHGGQISVEILNRHLSVARFYTPYVYGLYQKGKSSIYVTRGIGTVGVPARLGAPPEIALIRLCAS